MPKTKDPLAFTVAGTGRFPVDMLRYDGAYPATGQDAAAIGLDCSELRARDSRRTVRLLTHIRTFSPTIGRWNSFGWSVVSHDANGYPLDADELQARIEHLTRVAA